MRWLMLALGIVITGCAGQQLAPAKQESVALRVGDATAPPSLRALPELDKARSERLHRALAQAGQVFAAPLPPAPRERAYLDLWAWVEDEVANWVLTRRDSIEEARFQFSKLTESDPEARAIGSAIIGMLQEDTARQLSRIPAPEELDREPEIAKLFRELVAGQTEPFVQAARAEYVRCTNVANDEGRPLERFALFCNARSERLEKSASMLSPQPMAAVR